MKNLIKAIRYLHEKDSNGTYEDMIKEIEREEVTVLDAKIECVVILQRWQNEEISPYNVQEFLEIQRVINDISYKNW